MPEPSGTVKTNWRIPVIVAGTAIFGVFLALMIFLGRKQDKMLQEQESDEASAVFDTIVLARRWNSEHGGVFVEKKPGMASNPFLKNPDIKASNGKTYTLKNPATMTREISELARADSGIAFHITSLKPLNPANAPDPWERRALTAFEAGARERREVTSRDGRRTFRLMRPLLVEASCLPCHAVQGYRLGQVRGGISVNLPYDETWVLLGKNAALMTGLSAGAAALFAVLFYLFIWNLLERVDRQNAVLSDLNHTKDRFLGMAAHDLRNPLAVVYSASKALQAEVMGEHSVLVDAMVSSADRMLRLINDLLDVAKINAGHLDLKLQETDFAAFLRETVRFNAALASRKGIAIVEEFPPGLGIATLDPDRMRQVLDNLISNALKFSDRGTTVTVGAAREGSSLVFWVQDQGPGIKAEDIPKLFGEFCETFTAPTAGEPCTGLGLAICKRLVELHGGNLTVASEIGKGTRFTVFLREWRPPKDGSAVPGA